MFGRAPILPVEMEIKSKPNSEDFHPDQVTAVDMEEKVRVMISIRNQVKAQAMQNIDKAQERQNKSYDAKHQPLRFKEGDTVLLRNMRNKDRKGGKLEQVWSGPYTVAKVLPKGVYKLKNNDDAELKTSFNSTRLKIYHPQKNHSSEKPAEKQENHPSEKPAEKQENHHSEKPAVKSPKVDPFKRNCDKQNSQL